MGTINAINIATGAASTVLTGNGVGVTPTFQAIPASGDVTAAANLTDDFVITGDGGAKGVQTSTLKVAAAGQMTNANQPAFLAILSTASVDDVTGDNTTYTLICNSETYDQGDNYDNTTGIFTAPVAGRYHFDFTVCLSGILSTHTGLIILVTSSCQVVRCNPFVMVDSAGYISLSGAITLNLAAAGTARVNINVSGGTKVVDVQGGSIFSRFSGYLVC